MIDISRALLDPTSVFTHPKEVLDAKDLSRQHKIDILRRWAYDAKSLETASDENMTTQQHGTDHLADILKALNHLGVGLDKD